MPLRSHGSMSLNWALMASDLVDLVHVSVFPVISAKIGTRPIFGGAADFDLELVESGTHRPVEHRTRDTPPRVRPTV